MQPDRAAIVPKAVTFAWRSRKHLDPPAVLVLSAIMRSPLVSGGVGEQRNAPI